MYLIKHKKYSILLLNVLFILLFAWYQYVMIASIRVNMSEGEFWMIYLEKVSFFLIPIYLHNLILVRFFFKKERLLIYGFAVFVLILLVVSLRYIWARYQYPEFEFPILIFTLSHTSDLIVGAGIYFIYKFYHTQREQQALQLAHRELELNSLKSKLNQHFLFNALNTIYHSIKTNNFLATTLMEQLASLLRYQLEKSTQEKVFLKEELDFINSYMILQQTRFKDQVSIFFNIEGTPNQYLIEPLLLMPLIENVFKHGNLGMPDACIHIQIALQEERLILTTENSFEPGRSVENQNSLGLGIKNLKQRLTLLYPTHQLKISSDPKNFYVQLKLILQHER